MERVAPPPTHTHTIFVFIITGTQTRCIFKCHTVHIESNHPILVRNGANELRVANCNSIKPQNFAKKPPFATKNFFLKSHESNFDLTVK
jgi:hypothetical protein